MWEKLTTESVQTVACIIQDNEIEMAKETELKWLCQFNTYEEVIYNDQPTMSTKWRLLQRMGQPKLDWLSEVLKRCIFFQRIALQ